jgi:hypothetical protein
MAAKESQHREILDDLNEQLTLVRRQYDDLKALSRDQVAHLSHLRNLFRSHCLWLGDEHVDRA